MPFNKRENIQFIILTKIIKLFTLNKSYTWPNYKVLNTVVCLSSEATASDSRGFVSCMKTKGKSSSTVTIIIHLLYKPWFALTALTITK